MNRIRYLRNNAHVSLRDIEKMIGMQSPLVSFLENEKRLLRQNHIEVLTSFFKVSSDFLLGKSDKGIFVEVKNDFVSISIQDYEKYKAEGSIVEYVECNSVWRIPTDELEQKLNPAITSNVRKEIMNELDELPKKQLDKVLNFIKDYIKK